MGYPSGAATTDLIQGAGEGLYLPHDFRDYSFYQLVELLHRLQGRDPEGEEWEIGCSLLFRANPSLGFAPSDLSQMEVMGDGRIRLETRFLGLNGAHSPLPGYLLDLLLNDESGVQRTFLDFFNNRLTALLYRAWRKHRYYVRFKEDARDPFSARVFALVGLGNEDLRGETPINWCKMLAYAGMLAARSRSPQAVSGIIAHCFDLEQVEVRQWQFRYVEIPPDQLCRLGQANAQLGMETMLGERVSDIAGKFVLSIKNLTLERFRDFLPSGREFLPLCKVLEVILREQMAYDLELTLKREEVPRLQLGNEKSGHLGWSSFFGEGSCTEQPVVIQIRQ